MWESRGVRLELLGLELAIQFLFCGENQISAALLVGEEIACGPRMEVRPGVRIVRGPCLRRKGGQVQKEVQHFFTGERLFSGSAPPFSCACVYFCRSTCCLGRRKFLTRVVRV